MLDKGLGFDEKKIRCHQRFANDILDGMIDWVRVIDKTGTIIYVNKPMREAIGRQLIGTKCYSVLGKGSPCKRCISKTTILTGEIVEKEEKVGEKIFSVKSSPVKDENGEIYAAVEVFRDVTRERKLEKELIRKNEILNEDLRIARSLQSKIFPRKGNYDNINVDYIYKPSEMLSGDMFDVFHIDEEHIGIYISDVVGHGVSASMMTMFVRQTMRAVKDEYKAPAKALSELHKRFLSLDLEDDKYLTIFYGVLNKKDKTLVFANGGHNSLPILIGKDGVQILEAKGYPITYLFNKVDYKERKVKLKSGDKILFYTDGVIEAKDKSGEEFGLKRLINIIKNENENLLPAIENNIDNYNFGKQEDDFALLMVEVL
ncbi:SpoIIE family protein phosphatase [Thermohalobacter berrensis]|uniref:Phosphatase n=1 Tax=Thermohalobacter berrensis TaxID=99594 RepID=A0A419T8X3_9FIRM|nr:SpoIIE family protein phosphatase [Thermohalobacter berrensis]RKD33923.1 phosphatase [Thermohalobacter berrensis]